MLFAWHTEPIAPWQTESWLAEMRRSLRPSAYARMITNEFVSAESAFVDLASWDGCVVPELLPLREDQDAHVWVGVDASVKRDSTALVCCSYSKQSKSVRLVAHKTFTPSAHDPIDFEGTVAATVLDWRDKFLLRKVYYDPFQMVAVAQRLARAGCRMEEFPQTIPNLTAATSNLFDLIQSRSIQLYPDAAMRLAISRAVMHESSRGWRLDKLKQQHKIDVVVALSMAALGAVRGQGESSYPSDLSWVSASSPEDAEKAFLESRMIDHLRRYALSRGGYVRGGWQ
jgi:phage terminase large subunit-like protein